MEEDDLTIDKNNAINLGEGDNTDNVAKQDQEHEDDLSAEHGQQARQGRIGFSPFGIEVVQPAVGGTFSGASGITPREMTMNRSFSFSEISSHLLQSGGTSGASTPLSNVVEASSVATTTTTPRAIDNPLEQPQKRRRASMTPASSKTPLVCDRERLVGGGAISPESPLHRYSTTTASESPYPYWSPRKYVDHHLLRPSAEEVNRSLLATLADLRSFAAEYEYTPRRSSLSGQKRDDEQQQQGDEEEDTERGEIEIQLAYNDGNDDDNDASPDADDAAALEPTTSVDAATNETRNALKDASSSSTKKNLSVVDDALENSDNTGINFESGDENSQQGVMGNDLDLDEELARLERQFLDELGQHVEATTARSEDDPGTISISDLNLDDSGKFKSQESDASAVQSAEDEVKPGDGATADSFSDLNVKDYGIVKNESSPEEAGDEVKPSYEGVAYISFSDLNLDDSETGYVDGDGAGQEQNTQEMEEEEKESGQLTVADRVETVKESNIASTSIVGDEASGLYDADLKVAKNAARTAHDGDANESQEDVKIVDEGKAENTPENPQPNSTSDGADCLPNNEDTGVVSFPKKVDTNVQEQALTEDDVMLEDTVEDTFAKFQPDSTTPESALQLNEKISPVYLDPAPSSEVGIAQTSASGNSHGASLALSEQTALVASVKSEESRSGPSLLYATPESNASSEKKEEKGIVMESDISVAAPLTVQLSSSEHSVTMQTSPPEVKGLTLENSADDALQEAMNFLRDLEEDTPGESADSTRKTEPLTAVGSTAAIVETDGVITDFANMMTEYEGLERTENKDVQEVEKSGRNQARDDIGSGIVLPRASSGQQLPNPEEPNAGEDEAEILPASPAQREKSEGMVVAHLRASSRPDEEQQQESESEDVHEIDSHLEGLLDAMQKSSRDSGNLATAMMGDNSREENDERKAQSDQPHSSLHDENHVSDLELHKIDTLDGLLDYSSSSLHKRLQDSVSSIGVSDDTFSPGDFVPKLRVDVAPEYKKALRIPEDANEVSGPSVGDEVTSIQPSAIERDDSKEQSELVRDNESKEFLNQQNTSQAKDISTVDQTAIKSSEGGNFERASEDIFRSRNVTSDSEKRRVDFSAVSSVTSASSPNALKAFQATGMISPIKLDDSKLRRSSHHIADDTKPPLFPRGVSDTISRPAGTVDTRNSILQIEESSSAGLDRGPVSQFLKTNESASYNVEESVFALMEDSSNSSLSPPGDGMAEDNQSEASSSFGDSENTPLSSPEVAESHTGAAIWNMLSRTSPRRSVEERKKPEFVLLPQTSHRTSNTEDWGTKSVGSHASVGRRRRSVRSELNRPGTGVRRGRFSTRTSGRTKSLARRQHAFRVELEKALGNGSFSPFPPDGQQDSDSSSYGGGSLASEILEGIRPTLTTRSFSSPDLRILDKTPATLMNELQSPSPIPPTRTVQPRRHSVDFASFGEVRTGRKRNAESNEKGALASEVSSPRRPLERSPASHSFMESLQSNSLSLQKQNIQFETQGSDDETDNDETHLEIALKDFSSVPRVEFPARLKMRPTSTVADYIASVRWRQMVARFSHAEVYSVTCKKPTSTHLDPGNCARDVETRDSSGDIALGKNPPFELELQGHAFDLFQKGDIPARFVNRDGLPPNDGDPEMPQLSSFITHAIATHYVASPTTSLRHPIYTSSKDLSVDDLLRTASKYLDALSRLIENLASFAVETDFGYLPYTVSIKDSEAVESKAASKYSGDLGQVKDIIRGRIIFPDEGSLVCALVKLFQIGEIFSLSVDDEEKQVKLRIVRMKNLFNSTNASSHASGNSSLPTGYRHVILNIVFDHKFIAEIQCNLQSLFAVLGEDGPRLHRDIRELEDTCKSENTLLRDHLLIDSIEGRLSSDLVKLHQYMTGDNGGNVKNQTAPIGSDRESLQDQGTPKPKAIDPKDDPATEIHSTYQQGAVTQAEKLSDRSSVSQEKISCAKGDSALTENQPETELEPKTPVDTDSTPGVAKQSELGLSTPVKDSSDTASKKCGSPRYENDEKSPVTPDRGDELVKTADENQEEPLERILSDDDVETPKAGRLSRENDALTLSRNFEYSKDDILRERRNFEYFKEDILRELAMRKEGVSLDDLWKHLVHHAVTHIDGSPRDVSALHCFFLMVALSFRMDYELDTAGMGKWSSSLGTSTKKEDALVFMESLLKRCLAISHQDSSEGMIGWVAMMDNDGPAARIGDRPLEILHEIGACFAQQGRWVDAEDVYRTLVLKCERLLPLYHPVVVASMLDLATCAFANSHIDFANKIIARASERVSTFLAEMEHSHTMHYQQSLGQSKSGLLMFEIDAGRKALSMLEAFAERFEKSIERKLMNLIPPDHEVVLAQRCILADCLVVVANCWALTELSVPEKRSGQFWRSAYEHYAFIFRRTCRDTLDDTRVASAAYGCARCLRELGKVSVALSVLAPVVKALSHSHTFVVPPVKQTFSFIPTPIASADEGIDRRLVTAQCYWLMAVLTADIQPDDDGRTKALKSLHKASLTLRHILDSSTVQDDPRRRECVSLLRQIEEEARRIFHPLRRASTQTRRGDRRPVTAQG